MTWRDGKRWPVVVASIDTQRSSSDSTGSMIVRTKARARLGDRASEKAKG